MFIYIVFNIIIKMCSILHIFHTTGWVFLLCFLLLLGRFGKTLCCTTISQKITQPLTELPDVNRLTQPLSESPNLVQIHTTSQRITLPPTDSTNLSQTLPTSNNLYQPLPTFANSIKSHLTSPYICPPFTTSPHFQPNLPNNFKIKLHHPTHHKTKFAPPLIPPWTHLTLLELIWPYLIWFWSSAPEYNQLSAFLWHRFQPLLCY